MFAYAIFDCMDKYEHIARHRAIWPERWKIVRWN